LSFQRHYPRVQLAIAEIYRRQERHGRELATLRSLADGYPPGETPSDLLYLQGLALKDLKRYRPAADMLTVAVRQGEPTAEMIFHLAEAQWLGGDPVNARLTVRRALEQDPSHAPSQSLHAQLVALQQKRGSGYRL
jgi:hypothetical protein